MSVQNVTLQALIDGVYTAVPLYADPVTIKRGLPAFSTSWPNPTEVLATVNNDSLEYDPSRPASLLYGKVGRNTRLRVRPAGTSRVYVEAQTWAPVRTPDHVPGASRGKSETGLRGAGLLERLSLWTEPLRSPMYRTNSGRATSIGHWSLEDDVNAVQLDNSLVGGYPGSFRSVELAQTDRPFGAKQTAKIADGSLMAGRFSSASTSAGWQVCISFRMEALPPSGTYVELFRWQGSNGYVWKISVNNISYSFDVIDASGAALMGSTVLFASASSGGPPTNWTTMRMQVSASGGTVTAAPSWYIQGDDTSVGSSTPFSGTVGAPRIWYQEGNATTAGAFFAHVFAVTGISDSLTGPTAQKVFNAYLGETTITRYFRVMSEAGLTRFGIGTASRGLPMGPQPIDQLLTVLADCRSTEDGDLSDERFDIGTTMRERVSSYDMAPALELVFPDDIAAYKKLVGADGAWNRVTVKNRGGGEWTESLEAGPMSVLAPPDGIGEIRKQIDVNVDDERKWLPMLASWHLAKGTLETPRYVEVAVELSRHPELVTDAVDVREGDLITLSGIEPDLVRLLVTGMEERVTSGTWRITYLCEPYDTFMVGTWDDDTFRWGTDLSTLSAGVNTTATALVVAAADKRGFWSRDMAGQSFIIAGERVSITDLAGAGSVAADYGGFETSVANWTATAGVLTRSTAQFHSGVASALITVSGSPASVGLRVASGSRAVVVATRVYRLEFWIRSSIVSANVNGVINWYAGASFLSSSGGTLVSVAAGTWTKYTMTATAPATATRAEYGPTQAGSPANGTLVYFDDVDLIDTTTAALTQNVTVVRSVNGVVKSLAAGDKVELFDNRRWGL